MQSLGCEAALATEPTPRVSERGWEMHDMRPLVPCPVPLVQKILVPSSGGFCLSVGGCVKSGHTGPNLGPQVVTGWAGGLEVHARAGATWGKRGPRGGLLARCPRPTSPREHCFLSHAACVPGHTLWEKLGSQVISVCLRAGFLPLKRS